MKRQKDIGRTRRAPEKHHMKVLKATPRFALGDELREHSLSPWDEKETKHTRAKVNAPHPTDAAHPRCDTGQAHSSK